MTRRIGFSLPSPVAAERRRRGWGRQLGVFEMIKSDGSDAHIVVVGWLIMDRRDLLRLKDRGERARVRVIGRLRLADDISPQLADEVLAEVHVTGSLGITDVVRERLGTRVA